MGQPFQAAGTAQRLPCPKCGRPHWGACSDGSRACFACGKTWHYARECPISAEEKKRVPARVFTLTQAEAEKDSTVVTGNVLIHGVFAHALLDSGATHSFISSRFTKKLGRPLEQTSVSFKVSLPSGETIFTNRMLRSCLIEIDGRELTGDMIEIYMPDYELILGMDWLSRYHASIDCNKKMVTL